MWRLVEPGEGLAQHAIACALEHDPVGHRDAFDVPGEDAVATGSCSGPVACPA